MCLVAGYGYSDLLTTVNYGGNTMNCWITTYFRKVFLFNRPDQQTYVLVDEG